MLSPFLVEAAVPADAEVAVPISMNCPVLAVIVQALVDVATKIIVLP